MITMTEFLPADPTLADVGRALADVARRVSSGQLEPKAASSTTYTLSQLRSVLRERDLEERLKEAKRQLTLLKRRLSKDSK